MIKLENGEVVAGQSRASGSIHEASVPEMVGGDYIYRGEDDHNQLFGGLGARYRYATSAMESSSAGRINDAYKGLILLERTDPKRAKRLSIVGSATLEESLGVYGEGEPRRDTEGVIYYQKTAEQQIDGWLARHPYLKPHYVPDSAEAPLWVLEHDRDGKPGYAICPSTAVTDDMGLDEFGRASNKVGGTQFNLFDAEGELDPDGSHFAIRFRAHHEAGGLLLPISEITNRHDLSNLVVFNVNGNQYVDVIAETESDPTTVITTVNKLNQHHDDVFAKIYGRYTPVDNRAAVDADHYDDYDINKHVGEVPQGQTIIGLHCIERKGAFTKELRVFDSLGVNLLGLDVPTAPSNQKFERPMVVKLTLEDAEKVANNLNRFESHITLPKAA